MTSCLILTAADAKFFDLAKGTLLSIRQKPQAKAVSLGFFDLGCTAEQIEWLHQTVDHIQVPGWDFEFPTQTSVPSYFRGLLARPHLRRYFPGFDVYVWIDADAWVQEWKAVDLLMQGATKRGLGIIPEVDRGNLLLYGKVSQEPQDVHYVLYKRIYGDVIAQRLHARPIMNAGVFALHRDAPHWEKWAEYLEQGLQNYASLWTDQMALNMTIYEGDLFDQTELLPAWCNWTCHYGLPAWDPIQQKFVEPYLPHTPIGILHLTSSSKDQPSVQLASTQGGSVEKDIHFPLMQQKESDPRHIARYDYISPGLETVNADPFFPNLIQGKVQECPWPYLRHEIPHLWYVDQRFPAIGFLSRDEAHILYNIALQFSGSRALEIGCWMGWSTCHLALAGVKLDVIDPMLSNPVFHDSVSQSLEAAGILSSVSLFPGSSPAAVESLYARDQQKWSLIFIDGDHEGKAPLLDAMVVEKLAEDDALVLFHDLTSPDVEKGLNYFRQQGWNTLIYQTMQIMGVAWRGQARPVNHEPDPQVVWEVPQHLRSYPISQASLTSQMMYRGWSNSLPQPYLRMIQTGIQTYTYRDLPLQRSPFDMAIFLKLMEQLDPKTVIVIGLDKRGDALWLGDRLKAVNSDAHVYSIDLQPASDLIHHCVSFLEGSGQYLADLLTPEWLERLPHPLLVIDSSDRTLEPRSAVLEFFHPYLIPEDYIVVENGIVEDLGLSRTSDHDGGSNRAIQMFLKTYPEYYIIDTSLCDLYGPNMTWNINGYLRKIRDHRSHHDQEFQDLLAAIKPYTLLSIPRLYALFDFAKQICQKEIPGNFVECGVYKGGSTALLSAVIERYSTLPRQVFACDTFEGMPEPTDVDRHQGIPANKTQFGAGTLKAPLGENLEKICKQLGVWKHVVPVEGLFETTLPTYSEQIGSIALLHADGDWYRSTLDIFSHLYPSVEEAGYIQIDDYGHWQGCRQAIHDFEQHIQQFFFLHSIDYTGVWLTKQENMLLVQEGDDVSMKEGITLGAINLVLFPEWNQPQEKLIADFEAILRTLITHPGSSRITLTVSAELDYQQAESLLTAAATNVSISLMEQGVELLSEPTINLVRKLNAYQWRSLLTRISFVLELDQQRFPAGLVQMGLQLPTCSTHQLPEILSSERVGSNGVGGASNLSSG